MMIKHNDGDYIQLIWDGFQPDSYYVKGHVDFKEAKDIIVGEECLEENELDGKPMRHAYARWSTQGDASEGCAVVLRDYSSAGRGRFKVTVCDIYNPEPVKKDVTE